ncbi:proclotting enzyme-like isoform X3 [Palaemon carinicauda]|uniref:proclotting enzyme-like isoform X3 n=1 Tax=Palaemon carinicauda TaxID=392227 RepID=UPI0035B6185F
MKLKVFLPLLAAYVCLCSCEETAEEGEKELHRGKRQAFGFPGFSLNPSAGGFQGSFRNPFGGNIGFNVQNPFAAQQQGFNQNRPQTFQPGAAGGFVPGNTGGFTPGGGNRPIGGQAINQNINCNSRHNRNHPQCQGGAPSAAVTDAFAQIPWLSQLTRDGQNLLIPNLPKTPASAAQNRFFLLGTGQPDEPFQQCVTPKFEQGHCRYLQHCILPEFSNSFANFLRYVCFIQGRYVGVCCPDSRNPGGVTPAPPPPPTPAPTPRPTTPPAESRGCGLIAKRPPTRIVGGKPADPQEWPWMAALLRDGATQYCGGTLITDRHVLTAAHCVDGFAQNSIRIRLGEYTFGQTGDSNHVDFNAAAIRMHEAYDRNTYINDIAIIALDRTTNFNADIWPVCLPDGDESYVGETATVTGWGTIYYGGPVATTLQEVTVPIWTNSDCDAAYDQDIIDNQLCAGVREGGKDSCQGDSGGPLLLRQGTENRWAVIGVVSWGIRCAEAENPGVYTRVSKYKTWIRNNAI